jgi:hypothetical protein
MGLTIEQLQGAAAFLLSLEPGVNPLPPLRACLPGVALTRCDASDMGGEVPFCRSGDYDLFLVDTSNHCWRIVDQPGLASGMLLASRS